MKSRTGGKKANRSVYSVDSSGKAYYFLSRNPFWKKLFRKQSGRSQKLEGYGKVLRNGAVLRIFSLRK